MSGDWQEVSRLARAKSTTTTGSPDPAAAPLHTPLPFILSRITRSS